MGKFAKKNLAVRIKAYCLLPHKKILDQRLDVLLKYSDSPIIQEAAKNLKNFLENPNEAFLSESNLDLLKKENIYPENLEFETNTDLIEMELYFKNDCLDFLEKENPKYSQIIGELKRMRDIFKMKPFNQDAFNAFIIGLKTLNRETEFKAFSTRFQGQPILCKNFLIKCMKEKDTKSAEKIASAITSALID